MSLKGIELQIAIPKTFDAGKIAEQKQQQSQLNQDLANTLVEKQAMKRQETVAEAEEFAKTDADKDEREDGQSLDRELRINEKEKEAVHPYKGAFVDFTG